MTYIHIGGKLISAYILENIAGNILKDICMNDLKPNRKINNLDPININKTKARKKKNKSN